MRQKCKESAKNITNEQFLHVTDKGVEGEKLIHEADQSRGSGSEKGSYLSAKLIQTSNNRRMCQLCLEYSVTAVLSRP